MCGIAGFLSLNNKKIEESNLDVMLEIQHHRGPDAQGKFYQDTVGFAHNRLSLLDLSSAGVQPFEDQDYVLTYNGEIYNYLEIKKELSETVYRSSSDTAVLFQALKEWGVEKTVSKIKGMFAFSWYIKSSNELFLVRDRIGIKPLFYGIDSHNTVWFSSEVKALLPIMDPEPNPIKVLYSSLGVLESSRKTTAWNKIKQVTPGSYLRIARKNISEHFYYSLFETVNESTYNRLSNASVDTVLAEFDDLFSKSVQTMSASDAPMGAFVSGGIDSSLIASYATDYCADIKLFTANVVGKHSEFKDAKLLSETLNKPLYDYKYEKQMALRDWAKVTWHYESPVVVHFNAIPFSGVSKLTRDHNVKAVLTGEGADELFLGYPKLLTKRYDKFIKLPFTVLNTLYGMVPKLRSYVGNTGGSQDLLGMFNELSRNYTQQTIIGETNNSYDFLPKEKRNEQFLTSKMLQDHIVSLLWRNDRMGMIYSIESRFPFLDESLIAFAMNLPTKYKIGKTAKFHNYKHPFLIDKFLVRKLAEGRLPSTLVEKKKNGFPLHGLRDIHVQPAFFENGTVVDLFQLNQKQLNYMCTNNSNYLVSLLASVEVWAKLFVERKSLQEVDELILKHTTIQ